MVKKIINIPDLGEAEDVEVIEICANKGDQVDSEDPIIVLESDKAAMEIPASEVGKVISIEVSVGDIVSSGAPFLHNRNLRSRSSSMRKKMPRSKRSRKIKFSLKK